MRYRAFVFFLVFHFLYAEQMLDRFHICTVASYGHPCLDKLILSCKKHKIDLEILGFGQPYYGNGTKLFRLQEYLNHLSDDDIVLFVDAFDVLIIADKEMILRKFLDMGIPFLMSAEKNCAPFSWLANQYPITSSPFRFLNAGAFIGYVRNLRKWLAELAPFDLNQSDQGQITRHYLNNKDVFKIDHGCNLFFSLYKVKENEIVIQEKSVYCPPTNSYPCIIHANGKSFFFFDQIYEHIIE